MSTVTVREEDIYKIPPMTPEQLEVLENWVDTDFSDCPEITDEQMKWVDEHWDEMLKMRPINKKMCLLAQKGQEDSSTSIRG